MFEVAKTFDELMKRLGYEKYIAQGGDWGSSVSKALAIGGCLWLTCTISISLKSTSIPAHSTSCRAIHLNMLPFSRPPKGAAIGPITPAEEKAIIEGRNFQLTGTGYQRIQASKPQTIGAGLAGNPIGILAWIGEKFHEWTDLRGGDGDFSAYIGTDRLITNVMIYYISNTIASSFRLYHYQMQVQLDVSRLSNTRLEIPVGISAFPKEIFVPPKAWCEYWCPRLVQWTEPERGGHFAALENGGRLVEDVRRFGGLGEVKQSLGLGARL